MLATQHELAGRTALANAGAFLCGQAAILAILIAAGANPAAAVVAAFLVVAAFEAVGGLPRAGVLAGHAAAAAHRVLEMADAPVPVPDPGEPEVLPKGFALRFEGVHFRWQPDRPPVFDGLTLEVPQGSARRPAWSIGCGQVDARGAGAEGGGAAAGQGAAWRQWISRR